MISGIHSALSERVVLNNLFCREPTSWGQYWNRLHEKLFVDQRHKLIFRAVAELYDSNIQPELPSIAAKLEVLDPKHHVTEQYLISLNAEHTVFESLITHVDTLEDCYKRRETEMVLDRLLHKTRDRSAGDIDGSIELAINSLVSVSTANSKSKVRDISEVVIEMVDDVQRRALGTHTGGLHSNLVELDKKIDSFEPGDLVIIAARPSMGKTTFMQYMALETAMSQNKPALVVSGEMKGVPVTTRLVSAMARINLRSIRKGDLDEAEWQRFSNAVLQLKKLPIHILDTSEPTIAEVREAARIAKNKHGQLGAIFVDYLQLVRMERDAGRNPDETHEVVAKVSMALKGLAMDHGCPVFALSQLSRESEKRRDRTYKNSDLRGSGQIEQDADVIIFIHREEVYKKDDPSIQGIAELIITKQRNGEIGSAFVSADLPHCTFRNTDWGAIEID